MQFGFILQGLTYDHVEMNLYLNGKNMHCPASGIRGTVYPVVYGKILKTFTTLVHFNVACCYSLPPLGGPVCTCLGSLLNLSDSGTETGFKKHI